MQLRKQKKRPNYPRSTIRSYFFLSFPYYLQFYLSSNYFNLSIDEENPCKCTQHQGCMTSLKREKGNTLQDQFIAWVCCLLVSSGEKTLSDPLRTLLQQFLKWMNNWRSYNFISCSSSFRNIPWILDAKKTQREVLKP